MAHHIYAFINELSFQGQFNDDSVGEALLNFLRSISRIRDIGKDKYTLLYLATLFTNSATHTKSFAQAMRTVTGEFKDEVIMLKRTMDVSSWFKIESFIDIGANYSTGVIDVSHSCLAEGYEYEGVKDETDAVVIVNLSGSTYKNEIAINKDGKDERVLIGVCSDEEVLKALTSKGFVFQYDRNSTKHPLPEQTILRDTTLFTKTTRHNKSEYLYERIGHKELWCLDDFHTDGSAHFEIFSMADDKWKGESYDLQNVNPDYTSNKHKGSKIKDK